METSSTIPKTIHFCWFGNTPHPPLVTRCIESWKKNLPEFEIKEWNEKNYDVTKHPFTKRMYDDKKWAFVADYARLEILLTHGGMYLDTDMEIVKDITPFLSCELLLGEEAPGVISAGMIGAIKNHHYIQQCKKVYDSLTGTPPTIPRLMTSVYEKEKSSLSNIKVCAPVTFYPYTQETIASYKKEPLPKDTYGVHLWNYSWGNPILRTANRLPIYHKTKRLLEILGIKKGLKKILGLS